MNKILVIVIVLGIIGIIYFSLNGDLQNQLLRKTFLNQTECDGEAVTYSFSSNNDFIVYEQGVNIPVGYSSKTKTFRECSEVKVYCGNRTQIVNEMNGSPKEGLTANLTFIAEAANSVAKDCFSDSCVYEKRNSIEVCK